MKEIFFQHKITLTITLAVWLLVGYYLGPVAFFMVIILSILEITLSADNAVVNSRVLEKMSPMWQKVFLTLGIFIAVFLIRFALPVLLVAVAANQGIASVFELAINHPEKYGEELEKISPIINGFGGMFLFIVATFFFVNIDRAHFWVYTIEKKLSQISSVKFIKILVISIIFFFIVLLLPESQKYLVGLSMFVAIAIYLVLHGLTALMEKFEKKNRLRTQVGWAAFGSFMYLEVLDASFSLDGVVGAFALTNNIVIIMAGLGIGALWVRTLTLHMVKHKTLAKYEFLESGAHWAILFLSLVMFLKLFHIELPELVVGSVGLIFVTSAIFSSRFENKKQLR